MREHFVREKNDPFYQFREENAPHGPCFGFFGFFLKKNNEKMGFSNRSGPNLMSFTFKRWGRGKNRRESSGKKMSRVREKNDPI